MGSKRRSFSDSSSIADNNIGKKLKGAIDNNNTKKNNNPISDLPLLKEIRDNPGKIEAMTVQQLRAALRDAGLPAKGSKRDLVSALACYLANDIDGENSLSAEKHDPSIANESMSLRMEARSVENKVQDVNTISEVSRVQRSRRTVKRLHRNGEAVEVDTEVVSIEQKLSVKTDGASGTKPSQRKRKVSSDVNSKDLSAENETAVPVNQSEPWTIFAHKKPQKGWIVYNPKTMRPAPPTGSTKSMKVLSWNVNGLRALLKLEGFSALQLAKRENFDVLCLQETKLQAKMQTTISTLSSSFQEKDVESIRHSLIEGYDNSFWTCSNTKLGYSGTAIISRIKPLSVRYGLGISDHDSEGRVVTAEFDSFYLLCVYVPNSGDGLKRLTYRINEWDPSLSNYIK
ncbi:hypothetical protein CCACVL1_20003, partial [Corchorus capsularis]